MTSPTNRNQTGGKRGMRIGAGLSGRARVGQLVPIAMTLLIVCGQPYCGGGWRASLGEIVFGRSNSAIARGAEPDDSATGQSGAEQAAYETLELRGRIVWLDEALARRFGIKTVPEARHRSVAIETAAGDLHPVAADTRGYAFELDPRLRVDGSFVVRRYRGSPLVQVIRVFDRTEQGRFELDYWCEICAIAMYQLKPCDCCQGPIELRRRPVADNVRLAPDSSR